MKTYSSCRLGGAARSYRPARCFYFHRESLRTAGRLPPPQGRYGRRLYRGFENKDRAALLASLSNDFEDVLFKAEPVLGETFSYLSSLCKKTMMTGSGSAFFLMAGNEVQQRKLAAKIKEERPQWYVGTAETIL